MTEKDKRSNDFPPDDQVAPRKWNIFPIKGAHLLVTEAHSWYQYYGPRYDLTSCFIVSKKS